MPKAGEALNRRGKETKERIRTAAVAVAQRGERVTFESVAAEASVHSTLVVYYFHTAAALRKVAGAAPCAACGGSGVHRPPRLAEPEAAAHDAS